MKKLLLLCCAMFLTFVSHAYFYVVCIGGHMYGFGQTPQGNNYVSGPGGGCAEFHPTVYFSGKIVALTSSPSGTGSEFDVNAERLLNSFDFGEKHTPTTEEWAQFQTALADVDPNTTTYVNYNRLNPSVQAIFDALQ